MFRKCIATIVALMLTVGGLYAVEIKGILKSFEDGKVTISVDGKDKTYKVDPDAKMKRKGKDGEEKEFPLTKALEYMSKKGGEVTLTVENDVVVSAKGKGRGKDGKKPEEKKPDDKKDEKKSDDKKDN